MSRKKNTSASVSPEEMAQVRQIVEHAHRIADDLRLSKNQEQAKAALAEISTISENAQLVLLKELSKAKHVDAADVLSAICQFSPMKSARKEAQRSLQRLAAARIYPRWKPHFDQSSIESDDKDIAKRKDFTEAELVINNFLDAWTEKEFDKAYTFLASDSPLREDLSTDEWIEKRKIWAEEAEPESAQALFLYERCKSPEQMSWLSNSPSHKEVEAGWSIEFYEAALGDDLPELPQATIIYEDTDRHWFWTCYTLVQENGNWRVHSMVDLGTDAEELSVEELQARNAELKRFADQIPHEYGKGDCIVVPKEPEAFKGFDEASRYLWYSAAYTDALLRKLPEDVRLYEEASNRLQPFYQFERCLAYLTQMTQLLPEDERASHLLRIAKVNRYQAGIYNQLEDKFRIKRHVKLAKEALYQSLALEKSLEGHRSLGEILLDEGTDLAETELHIKEAMKLSLDSLELTDFELSLGEIATRRGAFKTALKHYQRAVELNPQDGFAWFQLGETHHQLNHAADAEKYFKRAIELDPKLPMAYCSLGLLYTEQKRPDDAFKVYTEGLAVNPDAPLLLTYMGTYYLTEGEDLEKAEQYIRRAEKLDPEVPVLQAYRRMFDQIRSR